MPTATGPSRPTSSRAGRPPSTATAVPRVEEVDGERSWVFDGHVVGRHSAAGVIGRDGKKEQAEKALFEWDHDEVHVGAYDPKVRLGVLDECRHRRPGHLPEHDRPRWPGPRAWSTTRLSSASRVEIYNDGMAEIQAESGNRLLPMPLMPAWDVDACVAEAKRVAAPRRRAAST